MKNTDLFLKRWIAVFVFIICVLNGFGQEKPESSSVSWFSKISSRAISGKNNPSFLAIRSGVSVPFGKYHEKSLDGGSFTLAGFNVAAEGAWFFNPKFGVGASVGMNMHPVDVWLLGYEKVQAEPALKDLYIRSNPYLMITAMGGFYTQLPIKKKFSFTGKVLCGLLYGETPYQLYKPEFEMAGPDFYEITPSKDWKFSWQAGIGLKYDITPCYALVFDTEMVYDQLTFGFYSGSNLRYEVKKISFFNATLGVRFNL